MPRTIIPFGPQHPVLPEPIHLKLVVEDEIVTEALPQLGYVHRGLEKLTEIRDYNQMIQIVERVCGICSKIHAMCYCQGIEQMMGIEIPERAKYLRVIWSELHRIHSHLLWLGLFADAFGFESVFMQFWRIREKIMDINEATAGNRVIVSVNVVGGTRADLTPEQCSWILTELDKVEAEFKKLQKVMLDDYTVKKRTVGIGVLTREQAYSLGAAGPTLRGSGVAQDMRQLKYAAFDSLDFEPVVETGGDCYSRSKVRFLETLQSIDLVRQAIARLPMGETAVKVKGNPEGEVDMRVEQPRGELFYYLKGNGTKFMERVRIRTPTFANIPPLLAMLPGIELADVPVVVLSIDPCISCTER
ncbi:NADH-ubiquinone oxidoreductase chain 49kDa [Alkalidesulfovibrio alkalitolerans DSM 16529]|uniref:NADH-ubiquinone oxidoreductase chain 49kDa n=1 Tax=Alkalidesulfovibrio alkalitolerans DSM 16529 TaxID=1121439 RepID=S7T3C6_9BACT|nr:nickel-dependent hydrogenase large subunit [Alkalidesulfovibrio alkalitolerans]EPR31592.1 NADH-ubiquinone oxidoreductase chain 49kDa [Alkalidesulfovibrio alkalitolerans DSM 16529]